MLLLAASTFGCAAPAPVTYAQGGPFQRAAPAPASANLTSRLLAAHNIERARVGAPPLRWDAALAAAAAAYGPTLSRLGRLEHSARASRPGQRENLWMGSRGRYSPEQMVGSWASERQWFRPGTFPNVSSTGNWLDVSHYTQMIWRTTTNVGCAVHSDARMDYLICRYSPPGNVDGRRVP
ncbi:MAG TPA: CAP domain-containing protein [Allosphingosinicella sp.]|uniref:CAP domain-containing protein n=1 Tax=Allosphingosinicella sp. TaxID=2823234 RepID=UPI002ED9EF83